MIWVNEQVDPCGILHACIACTNEDQAQACHTAFQADLSPDQIQAGWQARLRTVQTWEEVPVNSLKLD